MGLSHEKKISDANGKHLSQYGGVHSVVTVGDVMQDPEEMKFFTEKLREKFTGLKLNEVGDLVTDLVKKFIKYYESAEKVKVSDIEKAKLITVVINQCIKEEVYPLGNDFLQIVLSHFGRAPFEFADEDAERSFKLALEGIFRMILRPEQIKRLVRIFVVSCVFFPEALRETLTKEILAELRKDPEAYQMEESLEIIASQIITRKALEKIMSPNRILLVLSQEQ